MAAACASGKLYGYGADVVASEPMVAPHPFMGVDNIVLTPHVGSRTNVRSQDSLDSLLRALLCSFLGLFFAVSTSAVPPLFLFPDHVFLCFQNPDGKKNFLG